MARGLSRICAGNASLGEHSSRRDTKRYGWGNLAQTEAIVLQRRPGTTTNRQQHAFVDNFTAWVTGPTAQSNCEGIEAIISEALGWKRRSGATFEAEKTAIIHFTRRPYKSDSEPFTIKGQTVHPKDHVKVLGMVGSITNTRSHSIQANSTPAVFHPVVPKWPPRRQFARLWKTRLHGNHQQSGTLHSSRARSSGKGPSEQHGR
jgi:hypothetical protein